ncbi:HAD-IA family hydrolase [Candidatus Dependentiae bacterium]|nr:HAD-IA family hydrolase [Candidatus Dependentiae bacterium]
MKKISSVIFDIGNVLFTCNKSFDKNGVPQVEFIPIEEGIALLQECAKNSEKGAPLVVACTNLKNYELKALNHSHPHIMGLFAGIVSPDNALARKPDLKIFHYLLDTYMLNPHEALFLDDDSNNIEAAQNLGLNGICVRDFAQVKDLLLLYELAAR